MTLARWLKKRGMSQAMFARLIDSDQGHVSDLVRGKIRPRAVNIERIAKATEGAVQFKDWMVSNPALEKPKGSTEIG